MAEVTTPATGVPQAAPNIENRLVAFLGKTEEPAAPEPDETPPQPEPAEPAPPSDTPPSDELSPEDLSDDVAPETAPIAGDEFEIVHNGTQHKLPRAEVIKLAQQGFDYTQKTQAIAERAKAIEGALQRAAEFEQIMPFVANEQAQVAAFKAQLAPYEKVDWVQLATNDPLEYPKYRAQYDLLISGHNQAVERVNQAFGEYKAKQGQVRQEQMQYEASQLPKYMPEWADQKRYMADSEEAMKWMASYGVDMNRAKAKLDDAFSCAVLVKAMRYDKAMKSKGEKSKLLQNVPPVARPGVHPTRDAAKQTKTAELAAKLKKTGDIRDAAELMATRLKL